MRIVVMDPADPGAQRLLAMSDAYMTGLYPAASNHLESVRALQAENVLFIGAWVDETLAACGAVKILHDDGDYGEIKRVFVDPAHRGKGLSLQVMERLEDHLRHSGIVLARLETGIRQPEAQGLYLRMGYVLRAPYGAYRADPLSVFMEKQLIE